MIITLLSLLLGVIFLEAVVSGPTTLHWLLVIMLLFCFTSFYGMWVGSDDEYLYQVWGLGLFSRKVKIASIRSCYLAKNNTLLG